jgi:hypothetical protein
MVLLESVQLNFLNLNRGRVWSHPLISMADMFSHRCFWTRVELIGCPEQAGICGTPSPLIHLLFTSFGVSLEFCRHNPLHTVPYQMSMLHSLSSESIRSVCPCHVATCRYRLYPLPIHCLFTVYSLFCLVHCSVVRRPSVGVKGGMRANFAI